MIMLISSGLLRQPPPLWSLWYLADGRLALFDYSDGLEYWFTLSDGSTKGFLYSDGVWLWLEAMGAWKVETPCST